VIKKVIRSIFFIACGLMIVAYLQHPTNPSSVANSGPEAPGKPSAPQVAAAPEKVSETPLLGNVVLSKISLQKQDVTFSASFTIENKNPFAIKDVQVTCHHFANSGTEIDQNTRTVFEIVPANGSKRIASFSMGFIHSQATKSACAAVAAKPA